MTLYSHTAATWRVVWPHCEKKRLRRLKFDSYIGHQEAITFACKRLLEPFLAHKSHVFIAFGCARFNGTKGLPSAPTKRLYMALRKQYKKQCTVVDTDEYLTSQKCPRCASATTRCVDVCDSKLKTKVYGLKACQTCSIVYDRDYLGAVNIGAACASLAATGRRPVYLSRGQARVDGTDVARHQLTQRLKLEPDDDEVVKKFRSGHLQLVPMGL